MFSVPEVQKCSLSDTGCIKTSAQKIVPFLAMGISDLNIPGLDAMHVDKIKVDLAGLKLAMRDTEIKGLNGSVIDTLRWVCKIVYNMYFLKSSYRGTLHVVNL